MMVDGRKVEAPSSSNVVVCGGGLAGLTAAVTCLEAGLNVTLVEKSSRLGGTSIISSGLVWTFADYEQLRHEVPAGDAALQFLVHDTVGAGRDWLEGIGVRFGPERSLLGHGFGRIMEPGQCIGVLEARFLELGGTLLLNSALEALSVDDSAAIDGVRLFSRDRPLKLDADAVVLATGGFQGNADLLSRYVVADPAVLALRSNPWSTGDALMAAQAIGAALTTGLDSFYGHALVAPPARYQQTQLSGLSQIYGQAAVALNLNGDRFADESEGLGEELLNQQLARQPKGLGFYVFDSRLPSVAPIEGLEVVVQSIIDRARSAGARSMESATLEGLCQHISTAHGVSADRALSALRTFNDEVSAGRGSAMHPPRRKRATALSEPPFFAIPVQAGITFTMGGLATDDRGRVVRQSRSTSSLAPRPPAIEFAQDGDDMQFADPDFLRMFIPGLYAAGCDVGNVSHRAYVGGLATALTTARAAASHVVSYLRTGVVR